jgi:hypothetical protein
MKNLILLSLAIFLIGCSTGIPPQNPPTRVVHPIALIGDSEEKITKNYGQPIETLTDGAKHYSNGYQDIVVHYKDSRCEAVLYEWTDRKKLEDSWISSCLAVNSRGTAWITRSISKKGQMYYLAHNGKLLAQTDYKHGLFVYTSEYWSNTIRKLGKNEQPPEAIYVNLDKIAR